MEATILSMPPIGLPGVPPTSASRRPAVFIHESVLIPDSIVNHETFRAWAVSAEYPEKSRVSFINNMIWVDSGMEDFFSHNQIKTEFNGMLGPLAKTDQLGYFGSDGNLWSNREVGISTIPDALFFTFATLQSGRVRLIPGARRGFVEVEGTPDMILEVVSDTSEQKDTTILKAKCAKAGVSEYWLVDARGPEARFEIGTLSEGVNVCNPTADGWQISTVFRKAFQLRCEKDVLGNPRWNLLVQS